MKKLIKVHFLISTENTIKLFPKIRIQANFLSKLNELKKNVILVFITVQINLNR